MRARPSSRAFFCMATVVEERSVPTISSRRVCTARARLCPPYKTCVLPKEFYNLPQALIPSVFRGLAGRFCGSLCRALAAGNLDRLAAGYLVPGIVGHLPEEIGR